MSAPSLQRAALVISECQRGIVDPESSMLPGLAEQVAARGVIQRIAALAQAFRDAGRPVVYCTIAHRPDGRGLVANSLVGAVAIKHRRMVAGTPDVELPAALAPQPGDFVSTRAAGVTAWYGTDLDALVRIERIEVLVLTGVSTDLAIPGLAMGAVDRGYYAVLAEDCTAGTTADSHAAMVGGTLSALCRVVPSESLLALLTDTASEGTASTVGRDLG